MPQNKQMKIQWVTIDGKNVPFVLPQVWDPSTNDWRVTSDDYPLPTKDDLLLQKINELNSKVDGIIDGSTPANTQLTGSIVDEEIVLKRSIYKSNTVTTLDIPQGVKGAFVYVRAFGVTGTFSSNQGYKLWAFPVRNTPSVPSDRPRSDYEGMDWISEVEGANRNPSIYFYPTVPEVVKTGLNLTYPTRVDVSNRLRVDLRVSGTFGSDEGIDASVYVRWLK